MKTRILFASMVLPTLFAACTSEDLVENQNVSAGLEGRALLNPITVTVGNGTPESRFSWNETTGGWNQFTANDKFSAGLVDDAEGTVTDNVLTNYVYSSVDGKIYTTTSQMVEGTYMFYSYTGFETSAARGPVEFNLSAQTADLANPIKTVEDNQLFVTPLYKLEKENANDDLNMTFVSYWSTAAIKIQNNNEAPFKIVRMVLTSADKFAAKGQLSPTGMKTNYIYTYDEATDAYVLDAANAGKEGQKTYDDFLTADIDNVNQGTEGLSDLVLDCGSYEVKVGETVTAYMQVPAAKYTDMKLSVVVETTDSKGNSVLKNLKLDEEIVMNAKSAADKTENDQIAMYRGQTTALFGYENNAPKAYPIDKVALLAAGAAEGKFASSFDDVYTLVTETEGTFTVSKPLEIYNIGDVKVDDAMVDLLNRMNVVVKFANPIDIELESTANTTIKNIVFAGNVTLKKGSVTLNGNIQTETGATLTISEGTSLKVTSATLNGSVVNNGTLDLAVATMPTVKFGEKSSLTVSYAGAVTWVLVTGQDFPKTVTISDGATLKGDASNTITIPYTSTVTVAKGGTLGDTNAGYVVNKGTIVNNGTIVNITNNNDDDYSATPATGKHQVKATITNNNKITNVTLTSGLIVMGDRNASIGTVAASAGGEIDNTIDGFITTHNNAVVYAKYEGNQEGKLGTEQKCNKIIISNGTWTNPETSVATVEADKVTLVKKNATGALDAIDFSSVTSLSLTNSTVDGNLTVGADSSAEVTALKLDGSTFNGTLTVYSILTTLDLVGVTFNGVVAANDITTINVNDNDTNASNAAPVTTINAEVKTTSLTVLNIKVGAVLEVTADGTIGTAGTATVTNNGTVNNRGHIKADSTSPNGDWNGNDPENS